MRVCHLLMAVWLDMRHGAIFSITIWFQRTPACLSRRRVDLALVHHLPMDPAFKANFFRIDSFSRPRRYRDWRMIKSGHQYIASFLNARAFVAKKDLRGSTYSQSYILLWWLDDRLWWLWLWWLLHCFASVYASALVQVQDELLNKVSLTATSHNLIKLSLCHGCNLREACTSLSRTR